MYSARPNRLRPPATLRWPYKAAAAVERRHAGQRGDLAAVEPAGVSGIPCFWSG